MRDSIKLILGLLFLLNLGCTTSPSGESAGEYLDSSATTTRVKASLVDELGSSGFAVKVKTYKDQVQLSGFVDSARIKHRAGVIAVHVQGVKSVNNDIVVANP